MTWTEIVPIGKDEKAFFVQLGARIARLRKQQHITQVQLAELLNVPADDQRLRGRPPPHAVPGAMICLAPAIAP